MRNVSLSVFCMLLSLFSLLFSSCEYDNDSSLYYKGIERPGEVLLGIDLANVKPGDTLYIYTSTRLFFFNEYKWEGIIGI